MECICRSDSLLAAESFLAMLQVALSDPVFVVDYKRLYPVINDIDILQQACPEMLVQQLIALNFIFKCKLVIYRDTFKMEFILQAYTTADEHFLTTSTYPPPKPVPAVEYEIDDTEGAAALPLEPASSSGTKSDKEIQNVLDVLPYLERIVVEKLLQRYENAELAISAVLEGNLPPDLQELQDNPTASVPVKSLPASVESSSPTKATKQTGKFKDLGFGDDDSVIIKRSKGFPGQPRNLKAMLDDKTHVRSLKTRYQEYGYVSENEYDDEYDDSYDALAESETKHLRSQGKPPANSFIANELQDDDNYDDEDDDDDEDEVDPRTDGQTNVVVAGSSKSGGASVGGLSSYKDKSKDFCENPELVRERRAQNWNNKMSARAPRKTTKVR